MMEKTNSHKSRNKRELLGKSFSEILLQSASSKKPILSVPKMTTTKTVHEYQAASMTQTKLQSDNSQKLFNLGALGLVLKGKREEKGLTLDEIAHYLCLKVSLLNSIESGDWENLPHKVYARGYVRKYADLLGVYNEIMPYLTEDDQIQKNAERPDAARAKQRTDEKLLSFLLSRKAPKTVFVYATVIALTLGFFLVESKRKQGSEMSKLENAVRVSNSVNENDAKKSAPRFADTKKLMITCQERTWISVIIDGTEKKEFTLKPQEVVILNAMEKFDLLIGNAGGIRLLLDGKDTSFTGENGQVKRITLS
jgi:cytoskeleton protein RodZ